MHGGVRVWEGVLGGGGDGIVFSWGLAVGFVRRRRERLGGFRVFCRCIAAKVPACGGTELSGI